jgi:hypothetical protein
MEPKLQHKILLTVAAVGFIYLDVHGYLPIPLF